MRTIKQIPILILGFIFSAFSFKNNINYQTECVTVETDGYIVLKIWDVRKGAKYKPEQARKDAIHAIMYSGISGSGNCITQIPILNTAAELEKFKLIEQDFFSKKGNWTYFTRSSTTETTIPNQLGNKNWKVYQVSISKNELRKYLEDQKIIKALNSGF